MGGTEVVAIVGAISTLAAAIAGYGFSEWRARGDRAAARELARRERLYNTKLEPYLDLLRQLLVEVQIVQRTEDLLGGQREPPKMPPDHEWRDLRARIGVVASPEVGEAVDMFDAKVREFHNRVNVFRGKSDELAGGQPIPPGIGPHTPMDEYRAMEAAREEAVAAYEPVQTLVRDELANL